MPVVDLSTLTDANQRALLSAQLSDICRHIGFFQVINHGIEPRLIEDLFSMMPKLFALPAQQKLLIDKRQSRHFRGWEAVGTEFTNNRRDYREQVDIWSEQPARAEDVDPPYLRLLGLNQGLPDSLLPRNREIARW